MSAATLTTLKVRYVQRTDGNSCGISRMAPNHPIRILEMAQIESHRGALVQRGPSPPHHQKRCVVKQATELELEWAQREKLAALVAQNVCVLVATALT